MKFDPVRVCLLFIALFCMAVLQVNAEDEETVPEYGEILVVYPEEAVRRGRADNLSAIAQVLFGMRYRVDWSEAGEAGDKIEHYDKVIWVNTAESERMDSAVLDGFEGYLMVLGQAKGVESFGIYPEPALTGSLIGTGEYMFDDNFQAHVSVETLNAGVYREPSYSNGNVSVLGETIPLVSGMGKVHYIPLIDYTTNFAKALLTQEIGKWLWQWSSPMHAWSQHVVLDAVYPFTDPYRLKEIVEYMVDLKMNFVISVMPIYEHEDYPAMQRFCEVLRFAQANGGGIILHAPIIQTSVAADTLSLHLTTAFDNYLKNGVWVLGMEIPSEWAFHEDLLNILGRTRTLFFSELDAFESRPVSEYDMTAFLNCGNQQVVPAFRLDETGISHTARFSTAVYVNLDMTKDDVLYSVIDAVKDAPIPMQSLWDMEEMFYADNFEYLTWDRSTLIVNGTQQFNVYEPAEISENYDYKRNIYYRFVTNLANQNHFLIGLSGVVLALFIFLVFQSRQQMHKRFLKKIPEQSEGKES